jgi:hypothetical protein
MAPGNGGLAVDLLVIGSSRTRRLGNAIFAKWP